MRLALGLYKTLEHVRVRRGRAMVFTQTSYPTPVALTPRPFLLLLIGVSRLPLTALDDHLGRIPYVFRMPARHFRPNNTVPSQLADLETRQISGSGAYHGRFLPSSTRSCKPGADICVGLGRKPAPHCNFLHSRPSRVLTDNRRPRISLTKPCPPYEEKTPRRRRDAIRAISTRSIKTCATRSISPTSKMRSP